ncbi:MAG: hypothetical protein LGB70_02410 [Sulfurovum sp.]|nr:hypothetical protein [Sulfurovum sp.]
MSEKVEFFQTLDPQNKCGILSENYELSLELENISLSDYSPNVVRSSEDIARMVFSPLHIDEDGTIKASAFDDVRDKGLSVHRLKYTKSGTLKIIGDAMASNAVGAGRSHRDYIGYVKALTEDIRKLMEGEQRLFCVYDTAKEEEKSHADVCAVLLVSDNPNLGKKAANKQRRKRLQELFSPLIKDT